MKTMLIRIAYVVVLAAIYTGGFFLMLWGIRQFDPSYTSNGVGYMMGIIAMLLFSEAKQFTDETGL